MFVLIRDCKGKQEVMRLRGMGGSEGQVFLVCAHHLIGFTSESSGECWQLLPGAQREQRLLRFRSEVTNKHPNKGLLILITWAASITPKAIFPTAHTDTITRPSSQGRNLCLLSVLNHLQQSYWQPELSSHSGSRRAMKCFHS